MNQFPHIPGRIGIIQGLLMLNKLTETWSYLTYTAIAGENIKKCDK